MSQMRNVGHIVVGLMGAAALSPAAGLADAGGPDETVTYTYNTCEGRQKFTDVHVEQRCETHRVTYATRIKVIRRVSAAGEFAVAQASRTVEQPIHLWIRVLTSPRQRADVIWGVDCERVRQYSNYEDVQNKSDGGHLTTRSSTRRLIPLPVSRPSRCAVTATSAIERGTVRLRLLATVLGPEINDVITSVTVH